MSTGQKLNVILAQAVEDIKSATREGEIEGGIVIMASIPTEDGMVQRHTVTVGKGAAIASTMTLAMIDEPKLEMLTEMVLSKLPLAKLIMNMRKGMDNDLIDSIESGKLN